MTEKDNAEKKESQTLGDVVGDIVESVAEAVGTVVETVAETVGEAIGLNDKTKEETSTKETKINEENELNKEERIGYVGSGLPQADETEEEAIIEADEKAEVEAAIARARETHEESTEAVKDPLVAEFLPALPRRNRARLQIQSPNRIHLYWSLAGNPFETLQKAFGNRAVSYQLVTRLVNLGTGAESYAAADVQGDWWYSVRSNAAYRVDLGFYAPNRPFIRLLTSNAVSTPRPAPSNRAATEADWVVSTREFISVLTASGYSHDVLQVAFGATDARAGEISEEDSTLRVANRFAPVEPGELNLAELRWLLVSLATGVSIAEIGQYISPELVKWLEKVLEANPDALTKENVRTVLESIFGSEFVEMFADKNVFGWERLSPVAIGASAIHFPEILFPKLRLPELRAAGNPTGDEFGAGEESEEGAFAPSSAEFVRVSSDEFI
jgi:hypothetical protein